MFHANINDLELSLSYDYVSSSMLQRAEIFYLIREVILGI